MPFLKMEVKKIFSFWVFNFLCLRALIVMNSKTETQYIFWEVEKRSLVKRCYNTTWKADIFEIYKKDIFIRQ